MASTGTKRRRIHVSKNKKKSWNKYSDIKDIDEFLEEKRREEIFGDDVKKKTNEQIFFIAGADDLSQDIKSKDKKNRPLRCFQALSNYSKVAIPVSQNFGIIGKKQKRRASNVLEKKLKNIELPKQPDQQTRLKHASRSFYNLWGEDKKDEEEEEIIQKKKLKVPCHRYQKPSLLPSIEIPHPGASYNPTYEDHQKLLLEAVLVEQKKEKEEQHLKRVLDDMFPSREEAPTHETWLQEMSQGLFEENGNKDVENEDEGLCEVVGNPAVCAEDRKTRSQKRKKKMIKEENRQRSLAKLEKKRIHDVYRLQTIKTAIKELEKKSEERQHEKDKREMERMYKPHTLSHYKYEPHDLEVNLTEELPQSLRTLKVEGDLLEDRYKSLQRRNILEPRIKQRRKRKYKLKVQVKRSHRDFH